MGHNGAKTFFPNLQVCEVIMARTNFQYEKRQRELEKKKKAEEKARRKLEAKSPPAPREDAELAAGEEGGSEQRESRDPV
jgi:hypothetical protein